MRPEMRKAKRANGIAQWADADDETRAAWRAAISKGLSRPEVRKAKRERAIEWQANNPEKVAAARAKARATTMRKRQKRLDDAPDAHGLDRLPRRAAVAHLARAVRLQLAAHAAAGLEAHGQERRVVVCRVPS